MKPFLATMTFLLFALAPAHAEVKLPCIFGEHMVLQRDKAVPVHGTAAPSERITVNFNGQTLAAIADSSGNWQVKLAAMPASTTGKTMTISGSSTITLNDILVGDVWLCSGQSNMDMRLGDCKRQEDVESAKFPGIRQFAVPYAPSDVPLKDTKGTVKWTICSPGTAAGFSAVAFYYARKIYLDQQTAIPIGLLVSSVGGTKIDLWVPPDGVYDIPVLHPMLGQNPLTTGTFSLFNGMIAPLAPYGVRGAIWYQGENSETTAQSPDSYFLKLKALGQGWKRVFQTDDFAFYYVLIANWGAVPANATPVLNSGGWDAHTRLQQTKALAIPHAGMAAAIDIGDSSMGDLIWQGWHPKDKLDVGERLALWALKNEFGHSTLLTSGPVLRDVAVASNCAICSFDYCGTGLMVGSKSWYQPTREIPGGKLARFSIAGTDGVWQVADALIKENTVILSSLKVSAPRKVSYACWQNPEGCNLYNKEGLPAAPFHVEDITAHFSVTASASSGGEIAPLGVASYLSGTTALYTITPKAGYHIQDVKVDGVSAGSVKQFTFDPIQKNHTIAAVFNQTAPSYTITAAANGGGIIAPAGVTTVPQGGSVTFNIAPEPGNRAALIVDGVPIGPRESFTFTDVRSNHMIAVSFACTIAASASFGGTINPSGQSAVNFGESQSFKIAPMPGFTIASVSVDGTDAGKVDSYAFKKVTASHRISVKFKGSGVKVGHIPSPEQLIFACRASALPDGANCGAWPALAPAQKHFTAIGSPVVEIIDGHKYASINYEHAPGFTVDSFTEPIVCNGASIVLVARPVRNGVSAGSTSIVDVFYDRLVLGIRGDSGKICVRRNGGVEESKEAIPDGQISILSLVVQPDGKYKVFANGVETMSSNSSNSMTRLIPGVAGPFAKQITIGRNAPDAWSAFNGQIGDVFLYKTALTDAERKQLESLISTELEAGK